MTRDKWPSRAVQNVNMVKTQGFNITSRYRRYAKEMTAMSLHLLSQHKYLLEYIVRYFGIISYILGACLG